jgi:hypothetical protein
MQISPKNILIPPALPRLAPRRQDQDVFQLICVGTDILLAVFVLVWRGEFLSKFLFMTDTKPKLG